jgi:hypothetical protein
MKKRVLLSIGCAALFVTGYFAGHPAHPVYAGSPVVQFPKTYGHCVGAYVISTSFSGLVFEDAEGTIRVVNTVDGKVMMTFLRK